ncbi:AKR_collapsed_G0047290.mRNA.1.CDS.1 [Saccharomyces cerevisiae]|nr:AKR_collapsed_G0047290.mRNA.1.CDS.1 [Saccharomyces cerevisiae]
MMPLWLVTVLVSDIVYLKGGGGKKGCNWHGKLRSISRCLVLAASLIIYAMFSDYVAKCADLVYAGLLYT